MRKYNESVSTGTSLFNYKILDGNFVLLHKYGTSRTIYFIFSDAGALSYQAYTA